MILNKNIKDIFESKYNKIEQILNYSKNSHKKIISVLYIFFNKYSLITFLEHILKNISQNYYNNISKYVDKIRYFKNNKSLIDIENFYNLYRSNKILIEYNNSNCNFYYNNNNVILLNPFEYGLIGFNSINELFHNNISLINSKNNLKICNIDIYFSDSPIEIKNNTYIENIALIKAISELRKHKGIINYINDRFDTFYLNNPYLNKNVNYINWYKDSLNFNLNRYYFLLDYFLYLHTHNLQFFHLI